MCSTKKKLPFNKVIPIDLGCTCTRPTLSSVFNPKPKSKIPLQQKHTRSSSSSSSNSTPRDKTVNFSSPCDTSSSTSSSSTSWNSNGFGPKSVAVEKDSSDPYLDFRESMLQMIDENEISTKDDLKELLKCFLKVNAPSLHGLIIRVFTEIWNAFFFSVGTPHFSSSRSPFFAPPKSYPF